MPYANAGFNCCGGLKFSVTVIRPQHEAKSSLSHVVQYMYSMRGPVESTHEGCRTVRYSIRVSLANGESLLYSNVQYIP